MVLSVLLHTRNGEIHGIGWSAAHMTCYPANETVQTLFEWKSLYEMEMNERKKFWSLTKHIPVSMSRFN